MSYLTRLYGAGYKLNNGNVSGLTNLQKIAIIYMNENNRRFSLKNKAFLVVD